jgi:hypothetical protein
MKRKRILSFEDSELNVDKVAEAKIEESKGDDFDNLYQDLSEAKKAEEEPPVDSSEPPADDTPPATDSEPKDATEDDSDTDEPEAKKDNSAEAKPATPEDKKDEDDTETPTDADKETKEAIESLREHYSDTSYSVSSEDFSDHLHSAGSYLGQAALDGASYAGNAALDGIKYVAGLGVAHGPDLVKAVGRGILYSIEKILSSLIKSSIAIVKFAKKHIFTFKSYKAKIVKLKEALNLYKSLTTKKEFNSEEELYKSKDYIKLLKIKDNFNFDKNSSVFLELFNAYTNEILIKVRNNLSSTKTLISRVSKGDVNKPNRFMVEDISFTGFTKKTVKGYEPEHEGLDTYAYNKLLPGDEILLGYAPSKVLASNELIEEAYKHSKIFLGFEVNDGNVSEEVPFINIDNLEKYLEELTMICDIGIKQDKVFDEVIKIKDSLKSGLRDYLGFLYKSKEQVSTRESLIHFISLKAGFIDVTFISGSLTLQNYAIKHLNASTQYCKSLIKAYS